MYVCVFVHRVFIRAYNPIKAFVIRIEERRIKRDERIIQKKGTKTEKKETKNLEQNRKDELKAEFYETKSMKASSVVLS